MLVRDRMTTNVITVSPETPIREALALMRRRHIRRLPVLQEGELVGIVTWTDLMRAQPSAMTSLSRWEIPVLLEKAQVREVMTPRPRVVAPDIPLEEAAMMMRLQKIGGLPVVQKGVLLGIVTESDIFDAFIALLGAPLPSYRVTVEVNDTAAALPDVTAAVRVLGLRLYSLATYPGEKGRLRVVLRVEPAIPLLSLVEGLKEHGLHTIHATGGTQFLQTAQAPG